MNLRTDLPWISNFASVMAQFLQITPDAQTGCPWLPLAHQLAGLHT